MASDFLRETLQVFFFASSSLPIKVVSKGLDVVIDHLLFGGPFTIGLIHANEPRLGNITPITIGNHTLKLKFSEFSGDYTLQFGAVHSTLDNVEENDKGQKS